MRPPVYTRLAKNSGVHTRQLLEYHHESYPRQDGGRLRMAPHMSLRIWRSLNTNGAYRTALIAAACCAVALLLVRSLVGVGLWGDEPYGLSTALRYVLGDKPLVDSWDTNFSSAIMAMPFVSAYLRLAGSTEGILLAFRGVWVALVVTTSAMAFVALSTTMRKGLAAILGILLLIYLPYLSPYVGYGADWLWHMFAAFIAVFLYSHPPKHRWAYAIPGVVSALGIIGNPPTLTVVPFFTAAIWLAFVDSPTRRRQSMIAYLTGVACTAGLFLLVLLALSGSQVLTMLSHVSSPDDHDFSAAAQVTRLWQARWSLLLPLMVGFLSGITWRRSHELDESLVEFFILSSITLLGIWAVVTQRIPMLTAPQTLVFMAALALLLARLVAGGASLNGSQLLLILPATGAGVGWFLGSNGGFASAVLASPLLLAAGLIWWSDGNRIARSARVYSVLATCALVGLVAVVAGIGLYYTPEGVTLQMTTPVDSGPFKGVFTTADEAARIAAVQSEFNTLPPVEGRTVFFERFPLGYLLDGVNPGTYSTWATSASSDRLQTYIDATGRSPQRLVLTRFAADLDDGEFSGIPRLRNASDYREVYRGTELRVLEIR